MDLGRVEHVVLLVEGYVLRLHHAGQRVRRGLEVGKTALLGLGLPLLGVAVALEEHALVVAQGVAHPAKRQVGELVARLTLELGGKAVALLGHGGVEHHVGVGQVLLAAAHAELELVAREGEGRGAVAVRGVAQQVRQRRHAQVHDLGLVDLGLLLVNEGLHDGVELVAQEDGDDGGRRLVGAETVIVARGGHARAQQVRVLVNGSHERGQEHEELQVLGGHRTRLQQVLAVGADGPVVVLARAVHVLEGLLVLQAGKSVVRGHELELLHREEVIVDGERPLLEDRRELVLGGRDLVVLGLDRHAELPELVVDLLHEVVHRGTDGAEVVLLELLALDRLAAKERAAAVDEVGALLVVLLAHEEVLLLGADGGEDALGLAAKERKYALGLGL